MSHAVGRTMLAYHRAYRHVNAEHQVVGRLATHIAALLMGKHKPIYDPAADCGDNVVVTNAKYLLMTGKKTEAKVYYYHTGRPGHLKVTPLQRMIEKKGTGEILKRAVSGMLPKNKLRRKRLDRLRVFDDTNTGGLLKNAIKRYDNIVVPSAIPVPEDLPSHLIPSTSVKMQDDTPPLGSLGGLKPSYMYKPKVKKVKEKKKKTPPGEMKIFNEEGKEVGIAHWKNKKASKAESIELVEEISM